MDRLGDAAGGHPEHPKGQQREARRDQQHQTRSSVDPSADLHDRAVGQQVFGPQAGAARYLEEVNQKGCSPFAGCDDVDSIGRFFLPGEDETGACLGERFNSDQFLLIPGIDDLQPVVEDQHGGVAGPVPQYRLDPGEEFLRLCSFDFLGCVLQDAEGFLDQRKDLLLQLAQVAAGKACLLYTSPARLF